MCRTLPSALIAAAFALMMGCAAARADDPQRRVLGPEEAARWRAVGVLRSGGNSTCSAVLISPSEAVTAAHCVVNRRTGLRTPLDRLVLVLGRGEADFAAARMIKKATISPDYLKPPSPEVFANLSSDIALLDLATPVLPQQAEPMQIADWSAPVGDFADIVGYEWSGPRAATLREGCMVLKAETGVLMITCDAVRGVSGAAVVLAENPDDPPRLAAVVSSRTEGASFVVAVAPRLAELRALRDK